jgi:hypothetical protein
MNEKTSIEQIKEIEELKQKAQAGDGKAQCQLADMYLRGDGVEKNVQEANKLVEKNLFGNDVRDLPQDSHSLTEKELDILKKVYGVRFDGNGGK